MNDQPLITVVIPLYNGDKYIRRSVQSVLKQSFANFELIVVDDGSTDSGGNLVLSFTDPRVRLVRQENAGVSSARNKGIKEGKGIYIAFLDADDEWDSEFLLAMINLSRIYPQAGIYGSGYRMVFPRGPEVEVTAVEANKMLPTFLITDYFYRAIGGSIINASGIMIPRQIFAKLGTFLSGEHHGEDLEMWARISLYYPIGYDTRVLFSFFQTGTDNKIRFNKLPKYELNLKMLQEVLANTSDLIVKSENIKAYIKNRYVKSILWFILNSNRPATIIFTKDNHADNWAPLLNNLIRVPLIWPFLLFFAWINRATKSRMAINIMGAKYNTNGVLYKIRRSNSV